MIRVKHVLERCVFATARQQVLRTELCFTQCNDTFDMTPRTITQKLCIFNLIERVFTTLTPAQGRARFACLETVTAFVLAL